MPKVGASNLSKSTQPETTYHVIDQKLQEYNISWQEFDRLRATRVTDMTQAEYDMMIDIRHAIPDPGPDTVMQKIIPIEQADNYFGENGWGIGGYITKRADVQDIHDVGEAVKALRLDYKDSPYINADGILKTDGFVRVEFTTGDSDYIDIPIGNHDGANLDPDPASGNGFIKSEDYLIPEYKVNKTGELYPSVKLENGSKVFLNIEGEEVLVGIVKDGIIEYVEG